jgi:prepilin-type processing-associated H-X9-DG protein
VNQVPGQRINCPTKRGFTLVEILVSTTIIIVLAALSFLAMKQVREKARLVNAMSSLRQVASFQVAYAIENQGDINTSGGSEVGPAGQKHFWGRFQPYFLPATEASGGPTQKMEIIRALNPLLNTTDADTMANTALSGPKIFHDSRGLPVPYSFNKNMYHAKELKKTSLFDDPSRVIYKVYGRFNFSEADGGAYVPRPMDGSIPVNRIFYLSDRKAMAAFLDGHAESISPPFSKNHYGNLTASP